MLVVGIDVGAEVHHVAVVDQSEAVVVKPTAFEENAHAYQNMFAALVAKSLAVAGLSRSFVQAPREALL